jgi:peptide/nickel transport system permease protein
MGKRDVKIWLERLFSYRQLAVGIIIIAAVVLLGLLGPLFVDVNGAKVGSAIPDLTPSIEHPLGTDTVGRDLLAVIVVGTPMTLSIGLIAGFIGLVVGTAFGFISGYYGGPADILLRGAADVFLTVPGLLILVVIASSTKGAVNVQTEALVVSALAWMWPTRTIRSQVLSMRERGYIQVARFSGTSDARIIVEEMLPNLLPYLAASFVGAVAAAILASIGLEALGLGPQNQPTLGMTIYWALYYTTVMRGLVWWWLPPIVIIVLIFVGLFSVAAGLDRIINPRLRTAA